MGYGFDAFERCCIVGFALGVVSWIQFIAAWVHYIIFGVLSLVLSWGYINLIDAYFISTFFYFLPDERKRKRHGTCRFNSN